MKITGNTTRLLQRSLNALGRQDGGRRVKLDGRLGRRTLAAFIRFLAEHGREGEARLGRAMRALGGPGRHNSRRT